MKRVLFLCLAFTVALSACNKNDNDTPAARKNLLTKRTDSDGLVFNFTYDASNRMVTWVRSSNPLNSAQNITFTYNANNTLASDFESISSRRNRYTYNADGSVSTKKSYSVSGVTETLTDEYTYTYGAGTVTENYVSTSTGNGFRQEYKYDAQGNQTEVKSYNTTPANPAGTYSGIVTYSGYDGKPHSHASAPVAFFFPSTIKHNVGTVVYPFGTATYTYEYNADGYPTKKSENGALASTYEYQRL